MRLLIFFFILLVILFTAVVCADQPQESYFPDKAFVDRDGQNNNLVVAWYGKHFAALQEPTLFQLSGNRQAESYRFLWLRTFHEPMSFRLSVSEDGSGLLYVRMTDGKGGYEPGILVKDMTVKLTGRQVEDFRKKVDKARVWDLPTEEPVVPDKHGNIEEGSLLMREKEDGETRYFIDLDLKTGKILGWNYDRRDRLAQVLSRPFHHRIFITQGQYNKLEKKYSEL